MRAMLDTRAGLLGTTALCGLAVATGVASYAFLSAMNLRDAYALPVWQWWLYALATPPEWPQALRASVASWVKISGMIGAAAAIAPPAFFAYLWPKSRFAQAFTAKPGVKQTERAESDNFGHADYMIVPAMQAMFPARPDDGIGGVVVGEADRVDLGPVARVAFDPADRATWGNGGKAPLLIDPCKRGSTHSMVIGGSGSFKSTALVASLLTWRKSMFVHDPKAELAALVGPELAARGRKVVRLEIGGPGPNVLSCIDINDPLAETRLRALVGRIIGPVNEDDEKARFKRWGRTIITALLAAIVWHPTMPPEEKNLRTLRAGLDGGTDKLRRRLKGIADNSPSPLARSYAGSIWDMVQETFSGAYGNATDDTAWLASAAYADLVSGDAYDMRELTGGNLAVFCQLRQEALQYTPSVARVLVGCHLDAVFAADANFDGRVYFPIDEAALIGRDPSLTLARDLGRASKITLQLFYQSEGQVDDIWTPAGKESWFSSVSWVSYAGIQSRKLAKELSDALGTYGVTSTSTGTNRGTSGKSLEVPQASRGSNVNEGEIGRQLAMAYELASDMRDDERLTFVRNAKPMRHGAAIAFRRPEMAALLGATTYRAQPATQAAE